MKNKNKKLIDHLNTLLVKLLEAKRNRQQGNLCLLNHFAHVESWKKNNRYNDVQISLFIRTNIPINIRTIFRNHFFYTLKDYDSRIKHLTKIINRIEKYEKEHSTPIYTTDQYNTLVKPKYIRAMQRLCGFRWRQKL